jgi:deoxyribose-phosphate aldolase
MTTTIARPSSQWRQAAGRGRFAAAELARLIDHTILKAQVTQADVVKLCDEAGRYGFGAVCVNSAHVPLAARKLRETAVTICAVVGFPLGAMCSEAKAFEAGWAVRNGATEIDMVMAVGHLKGGDHRYVESDIRSVVDEVRAAAARMRNADGETISTSVKVIIEACYLADEEKVQACRLAEAAGADYVKTSTGFGSSGATVEDVSLMRDAVSERLGVKAAGGIRDLGTALALIAAGADRLGLSAGVAVIEAARRV